ncbi:MAG: DUF4390 domain-containing protein [Wenzhouxiangellaceae bacterium]|nr:DUF4390 domain-containing protein [Wenzhouxiangellaceae bacterium]
MASTIYACAACSPAEPESGHLRLDPVATWEDGRVEIRTGIDFEPTPAMREALAHGVDLVIDVTTRVSRRMGPVARETDRRTERWRIRYLPLIEQWQLVHDGDAETAQNHPRLWLLLRDLAEPRTYLTGLQADALDDGAWQVQIRVRFNREALPSPMHLPTLMSPDWRLGGPWHSWQFPG